MAGEKKRDDGRFSDGGIVQIGDTVVSDTEAAHYDAPSLVGTKRPLPKGLEDDSTTEDE
jgi:hypothetical protein